VTIEFCLGPYEMGGVADNPVSGHWAPTGEALKPGGFPRFGEATAEAYPLL